MESGPVDRKLACSLFGFLHERRILEHDAGEENAEEAYGDVDVKDPAPGIVISDPPSGGRSQNGRNEDRDRVERHSHAAFLRRKAISKNGLYGGLQSPSGKVLSDPEEDKQAKRGCKTAGSGENGKEGNRKDEVVLAAENGGQPAADRKHNRVGNQVAGEHPLSLIQ
jgi:hypothetical protein